MGFYSIWPFFLVVALLLFLAGSRLTKAVAPPIPVANRLETLDGLRGFAALCVFFQHAAISHYWLETGLWFFNGSRFYLNLGQLGVGMFFMLTGFLFWGQILDQQGKVSWVKLYLGRFFRIVPLAWAAAAAVFVGVAVASGFQLREPVSDLVAECLAWLSAGALGAPDINNIKGTWLMIFGVTWTLQFEWLFYLSLPLLAIFSGSRRVAGFVLAGILTALLAHMAPMPNRGPASLEVIFALFSAGMLAAILVREAPKLRPGDRVGSCLVVILLASALMLFKSENQSAPLALIAVTFYLIASGISVFGLLTSTGAKRLGDVSFGIYLLQGIVMNGLFHFRSLRATEQESPMGHWLVITGGAIALVLVASAAHLLIERPGISLGKRVYRRIAQTSDGPGTGRAFSTSE